MIFISEHNSPIGKITLASDGENLTGLWLEGQKYFWASVKEPPVKNDNLNIFEAAKTWLNAYFAGKNPAPIGIPLAPEGTDFRKKVWRLLLKIPYGETVSYGELAKQISKQNGGRRTSARAVGGAVGHNPISIIIPCHRVIGADGGLTGYAGGTNKKIRLLKLEGAVLRKAN
ncbi:MAG: methylated-DNA--[protein]-cysteine S-methyltransferase [Elusimicrobiaceae bacterium]